MRRQYHEAAIALIRARTDGSIQLVALYKALGGGWDAPRQIESDVPDPMAPQPTTAD